MTRRAGLGAVLVLALFSSLSFAVPTAWAGNTGVTFLEGPEDGSVAPRHFRMVLWATSSDPLTEVRLSVHSRGTATSLPVTSPVSWTYDPRSAVRAAIVAATWEVVSAGSADYKIVATARSASGEGSATRTVTVAFGGRLPTGNPDIEVRKIDPPTDVTIGGATSTIPGVDPPGGTTTPPTTAPGGGTPPPGGVTSATRGAGPGPAGSGGPGGNSSTATPADGIVVDPVSNRDGSGGVNPLVPLGALVVVLVTGAAVGTRVRRWR